MSKTSEKKEYIFTPTICALIMGTAGGIGAILPLKFLHKEEFKDSLKKDDNLSTNELIKKYEKQDQKYFQNIVNSISAFVLAIPTGLMNISLRTNRLPFKYRIAWIIPNRIFAATGTYYSVKAIKQSVQLEHRKNALENLKKSALYK